MAKYVTLKICGIIAIGVVALVLFLQIVMIQNQQSTTAIPSYIYTITQVFALIIFLLGAGCIVRGMNGIGVVFTGFQIVILTSLIMGIPSIVFIIIFIIASILFLEITQNLTYLSEIGELNLPHLISQRDQDDANTYLTIITSSYPNAQQTLNASKKINIQPDMLRVFLIWFTILITVIVLVLMTTSDPIYFIGILFFVIFPLSISALILLRKTSDKDV